MFLKKVFKNQMTGKVEVHLKMYLVYLCSNILLTFYF